ncbi:flagellar associated [Chlorella sorokiniana]|uniref:Flagellar associated n=1 Tax=Chlorella sorokiniana TaxID=3076 RepID=A0A2P6TF57_CHLSO|nr:flagellar associated [Chlorella sorokiniana]|eukprot:PRW32605.1 flagellar associated [Chlorella sorokiniana]
MASPEPRTQAIIKRVQANFKDATTDAARQIIGEEVARFLREGAGAEEEDISALEDAIRNRLAGRRGASGKAERLAAKKSLFSRDEWSQISLYVAFMAREDEKRTAAATRAAKREVNAQLQGQAAEVAQRKRVEKEGKKAELKTVEAELQQFEKERAAEQQRRATEVAKMRTEREAQLEEQANRKAVAAELKKLAEEEMSTRIALDLKRQMEAEAAAKAKAKEDLKAFLLSNEVNKKIKEEEAEKERLQDLEYMRQQAAQLDKQERERQQLLEKVKAVQNRQAADAAQRPPFKRWVDEEIIERQFREKQEALAKEEAARKAAAAAAAARFRADVAGQLEEKEAARLAALKDKRAELVRMMADLEVCKKTEAAAKAAELAKMRAFKAELDTQIDDNQARRAVSAMSETERKLNAKLLREMEAAGAAGGIPAVRGAPVRSP